MLISIKSLKYLVIDFDSENKDMAVSGKEASITNSSYNKAEALFTKTIEI